MKIGIRLWLVFWLEAQKIFLPGSSDSLVRFFFCFLRRQIRIAQRPLHARLIPPGMASGSCWWAAGNRSHLFPHFLFFSFFSWWLWFQFRALASHSPSLSLMAYVLRVTFWRWLTIDPHSIWFPMAPRKEDEEKKVVDYLQVATSASR